MPIQIDPCARVCVQMRAKGVVNRPQHWRAMGLKILAQNPRFPFFVFLKWPQRKSVSKTKTMNLYEPIWTSLPTCHRDEFLRPRHRMFFFPSTSYILADQGIRQILQEPWSQQVSYLDLLAACSTKKTGMKNVDFLCILACVGKTRLNLRFGNGLYQL